MSLFQTSVLKKHIKGLDKSAVDEAWGRYFNHFHDKAIQLNIRNSKEEQYQEGFLRDLFVSVFGYVLNPATDFNLTTELKNVKGAKKTDGAILKDDKALAVIELKGTNTTDLTKVESQAFGYKNNQPGCVYVITSNFEKLRFYIDNAVDFEEFNLFQLTRERFEVLWLCLSSEYLLKNIPKQIKDESLTQEENITKKLYKDYSLFRNEIFDSIQRNNSDFDKLTLFKKTQKLLDRFLFIFFAEDRLLLPPNSIREIINQWTDLRDKYDEYQPLYSRFKKYFGYMNIGYKGKKHDIFAYNGGLFEPDEILDNIKIDDDLLYKHTQNLSNYDFESEVSVNILGHIFEHSLNEIEEIQAELEGIETDKSKSKRKKDGVFYTPKYITKYIVDNTVGKLCEEKKTALEIDEAEYEKDRKGRKKATLKALLQKLEDYRNWLLELTICDPACGSGAFLNQALEFLINEHRYIDELNAKLLGEAMILSEVENSILENNLFGVDINDESVEIAKLSLWLRTAQKGRKLTSLNNNIKCGNSLIDDVEVAGDKAFNWKKEFPKVFEKGGFDVVIGNPPYVRNESISKIDKVYFEDKYETFTGKSDLYVYFFELVLNISKSNSKCSFIVSSKFTKTKYGKKLIDFLFKKSTIQIFIDFRDLDVFTGIIAYPSIIMFSNIKPQKDEESDLLVVDNENFKEFHNGVDNATKVKTKEIFDRLGSWNSSNDENLLYDIFKRLQNENVTLEFHKAIPQVGIKTGFNKAYLIDGDISDLTNSTHLKDYVIGRNVKRYQPTNYEVKAIIPYDIEGEKLKLISAESDKIIFDYLGQFKERLSKRAIIDKGIEKGTKTWYEFQQIKLDFPYSKKYIIYPDISGTVNFTLTENSYFDMTCFGIPTDSYELLGILNSKLILSILEMICVKARGGYLRLKSQYLLKLPIPEKLDVPRLKEQVTNQLKQNEKLTDLTTKFSRQMLRRLDIEKLSGKLEDWHQLTFMEFTKELKNKKVKLSLSEEVEWEDYFEIEQEKAQTIKSQIEKTDKKIDQMVYELYGLTEEEIRIVEEATE